MKDKTVCFTGHRKIPPRQYKYIAGRLEEIVIDLIEQGCIYFGTGGALGFDTLAAQTVLHLKERYPQIKLILILPCKTQTNGWDIADIDVYEDIKSKCDKFVYISKEYVHGCMFKRNRYLVDFSSVCVCYLTDPRGGTAYTVDYAKKNGLSLINVADQP